MRTDLEKMGTDTREKKCKYEHTAQGHATYGGEPFERKCCIKTGRPCIKLKTCYEKELEADDGNN